MVTVEDAYKEIMTNCASVADLATAIREQTNDPLYLRVLDHVIDRYGYQLAVWDKLSHILSAIRKGIPATQNSQILDYLKVFPLADPNCDVARITRDRRAKARKVAGVPHEFHWVGWEDFEKRPEVTGLAQGMRLSREFNEEDIREGGGLLALGDPGTGKTRLMVHAADAAVDAGMTFMFATAPAYITANKPGGDREWVDRCFAADLLVVDDLGQERATDYATSEWELLISFRHNEKKATLWTSNLSKQRLLEHYGGRIIDRIRDRCEVVELRGTSYRGDVDDPRLFDAEREDS